MEKAGVSALVATVLIILLAILGVTILFSFVIPTVNDNLNEVAKEKVELTIETEGGYTVWDSVNKIAKIQVKRGNDNSVLDGIDFKFFAGANSYNSNSTDVPDPNQVKTYAFTLGDFGKPELVRISAIVNGKIQKATVEIGETSLNGDFDEGTVTGNTTDLTPCESYSTYSGAYELCNCSDLQNMSADLDASYILGQDIDCDVSPYNAGEGFAPIGTFTGSFDGNGHVIQGLYIYRPGEDRVGLFGQASGADIFDVGLTDVSITGKDYVGGLAGDFSTSSIIDNSYTTGVVNGTTWIGGIVGYNELYSIINNSHSSSIISGVYKVGGLVGWNSDYSTISNSYATGDVTGAGNRVGGLVGDSYYSNIDNSYATGNIVSTGGNDVGGLVGYVYGIDGEYSCYINNSYATGDVAGSLDVGGLVGSNIYYSTIDNSYATGDVSGENNLGGLVGYNEIASRIRSSYATGSVPLREYSGGLVGVSSDSLISSSYWYNSSSNPSVCVGDISGGSMSCTSNTTINWFYSSANAPMSSWDFRTIWQEVSGSYPTLR